MCCDPRNEVVFEAVLLSAEHIQEVREESSRVLILAHRGEVQPEFQMQVVQVSFRDGKGNQARTGKVLEGAFGSFGFGLIGPARFAESSQDSLVRISHLGGVILEQEARLILHRKCMISIIYY